MRCAYLTMDNTDGWAIDSSLSFAPMRTLGWSIDMVPWKTAGVEWDAYDAVYIGTPWDYPDDPELFLALLKVSEPSLYLRMASAAPMQFARAFDAYVARSKACA